MSRKMPGSATGTATSRSCMPREQAARALVTVEPRPSPSAPPNATGCPRNPVAASTAEQSKAPSSSARLTAACVAGAMPGMSPSATSQPPAEREAFTPAARLAPMPRAGIGGEHFASGLAKQPGQHLVAFAHHGERIARAREERAGGSHRQGHAIDGREHLVAAEPRAGAAA